MSVSDAGAFELAWVSPRGFGGKSIAKLAGVMELLLVNALPLDTITCHHHEALLVKTTHPQEKEEKKQQP